MDHWTEIRRRVLTERLSKRRACEEYGIHWKTFEKMLEYPEPPGYRCEVSRPKPKLDPYLELIEQILEVDKHEPPKQRHTAQRIYERLKAEHGFTGGASTVRKCKRQTAEVFVPLSHPPGEAQIDFGHAQVIIAGASLFGCVHLLCVSEGVHRDVPGRTCAGVRVLRRSAYSHQL